MGFPRLRAPPARVLYQYTQTQVIGAGGLAAVHAFHTADHAKHLANIAAAVAAFTAMPGVGTSRSSTGRACR
jgi:hypothetical protein